MTHLHFNSSRLIRILTDLALVEPVDPPADLAASLGRRVDFSDAVTLSAVLNAPGDAQAQAQHLPASALADELERLQASLAQAIQSMSWPAVTPDEALDLVAVFEPYRQGYQARQRDMDASLRPLRAQARQLLVRAGAALKRLAVLDATFEALLSEREARVLQGLPGMLEKRFAQCHRRHIQGLADATQGDDPATWTQVGGWLCGFGQELKSVLLAELDWRLQPTLGLLQALNPEHMIHE